ncbi:MAG: hypothetical protein JW750_05400 [Anaerolineaceae bacterium]|nr:hypothetical protein [Anaerolineaceae bacterium]
MNPRERILAAVRHQPVDRVPTDIWATPEVYDHLFAHCRVNTRLELCERLNIDGIFGISPPYIGPAPEKGEDYYYNEWGMGFRRQVFPTGEYYEQFHYPLAQAKTIDDLESFRFPSPDDYDYSALPDIAQQFPDRAIECGYTAIFYYHNLLRGLELSLMDPIDHPEFTRRLIQKISDFFHEYHRRCFEAAGEWIDFTQVTDDFGSQHSLLISPRTFDHFYRAPIQRAIDLAKHYNIHVFHHDDGDMRKLLPRLVEMGIEVLNPIQWRCGNWNLEQLKSEYGDRVCFHSAVDNQVTLPFGTPDDVRAEVRYLINTLGRDRTGFIIGPCHNLQPNTPIDNILALYDEANRSGAFED